MKKIYTPPSFG